jgi:3-deoxy-D-manno-octulosonic-acid transferase
MTLLLRVYRWLTGLLEPLAPRLLQARAARGKEDAGRLHERLGLASIPRPAGPLIWLHGVSVGETVSLLPLIQRLRDKRADLTILVTSGTVTSAQVLAGRLPAGVLHQYAPVDGPAAVASFLDYWRPEVGVLVESELWANLILGARARGVRMLLASARITERTADGWARAPRTAQVLLEAFDHVLPQDEASAERLRGLGGAVGPYVNLKLAGAPLEHDAAAFANLSEAIGDRPVVLAASTHEGEERAIVRALDALTGRLFLILAPRHPERGDRVAEALGADGYGFARRSRSEPVTGATDIYLADTLGELGLFMQLADVVVMGGSFGPSLGLPGVGGHNPLEPARLGKPAVTGADMSNWAAISDALQEGGGLAVVDRVDQLAEVVGPLLTNPARAREMGERARRVAREAEGDMDRLWACLTPLLPAKIHAAGARGGRR